MTNWIKNKILSFVEKAKDKFKKVRPSKDDQEKSLWINCPECKKMQLKEDLIKNFNVCKCSHHFDLDPKTRFSEMFFDDGEYELIDCPEWADPDPLNFKIGFEKSLFLHILHFILNIFKFFNYFIFSLFTYKWKHIFKRWSNYLVFSRF